MNRVTGMGKAPRNVKGRLPALLPRIFRLKIHMRASYFFADFSGTSWARSFSLEQVTSS
jgi:hypothetical protein